MTAPGPYAALLADFLVSAGCAAAGQAVQTAHFDHGFLGEASPGPTSATSSFSLHFAGFDSALGDLQSGSGDLSSDLLVFTADPAVPRAGTPFATVFGAALGTMLPETGCGRRAVPIWKTPIPSFSPLEAS